MISASMGYNTLTSNMKQSLDRVADQASVKREADYYKANINNVKTVDDFLGNYRLYSYAMKAYGLEGMTYGKAFMKKVLESDLTDSTSFANRLNDPRYKQFAAAFNFVSNTTTPQSDSQEEDLTDLYTQSFANDAKAADTETTYYDNNISDVKNVSDLIGDDRLRTYVLKAYNIDPTYASNDFLTNVLTSDVNDPNSFVNVNGDDKYKALAKQFNFKADGTVNGAAQTSDQQAAVEEQYNLTVPAALITSSDSSSEVRYTSATAADYNKTYYQKTIAGVTTVDDLVADDRLTSYIKTAYSLGQDFSNAALKSALTDPTYARLLGVSDLNQAFNFGSDGKLESGATAAQTADQATGTSDNYMARYDDLQQEEISAAVANYKKRMTSTNVKNINDFMQSNAAFVATQAAGQTVNGAADMPSPYEMALRAYGLTQDDVPRSMMRKLLQSDPYDPKGYVASLKDDRITNMVRDFNFGSDGKISSELQPIAPATIASYISSYSSRTTMGIDNSALQDKATKDAKTAATEFSKDIGAVKSLSDFLANSKLTDFVLKANGLDPKAYNADTLKKIFTSDPSDSKSYLNTKADAKFKDIVADFNFDTSGNLTRAKTGTVQNSGALDRTQQNYLEQTLESQQGDTNDGIRLALYFSRQAPNVTSYYSILGDSALYKVVQTAFNLPAAMSNMDTDQQVSTLKKFFSIDDLQNPTKLDKLVKRFTAMYDLQNSTNNSSALTILQSSSVGSTS